MLPPVLYSSNSAFLVSFTNHCTEEAEYTMSFSSITAAPSSLPPLMLKMTTDTNISPLDTLYVVFVEEHCLLLCRCNERK